MRHITAFLSLGTLDSTLSLRLGAILSSKIMPKHTKAKNVALNIPGKDTCVRYKLKQEDRALPHSTSAGNVCTGWQIFLHSVHAHAHKWLQKDREYGFWGQKF